MHPDFQHIKKTWWWVENSASFARFLKTPFGRGYELLRRTERFSKALPASFCQPTQTWKQLSQRQRDYFSLNYFATLDDLGFVKRIMAGPRGISFDASRSTDYLLKALKFEICNPTPVAAGENPSGRSCFRFRVVARFKPHPEGKEVYTHRPKHGPLWEQGPVEPGAYLRVPLDRGRGEDRELSGPEIYAYFRNFIKDNPPPDFLAYRDKMRARRNSGRQENPETVALGLLAHDYNSLPGAELVDLAEWLCRTCRQKNIFALSDMQLSKAIYHARAHVSALFVRAAKP